MVTLTVNAAAEVIGVRCTSKRATRTGWPFAPEWLAIRLFFQHRGRAPSFDECRQTVARITHCDWHVRRTAATADAGQRAGSAAAAAAAADDVQPLAAAAAAAGARTRRRKREQASSVGSLCNELIGLLHSTMRLDEQKPLDADKEAAFLETGGELLLQLTAQSSFRPTAGRP